MNLYLVRHGESIANIDKSVHHKMADFAIPLSKRGRQQARGAGLFLRAMLDAYNEGVLEVANNTLTESPWLLPPMEPRLWVSPYLRASQTADEIETALKLVPGNAWATYLRDRREHLLLGEQQFGLFDGYSTAELAERFPLEQAHYQKCEDFGGRFWARMPMGESRFDVCTRVHQMFGTLHRDADKHGITDLIIVVHGVTVRAIVMMWLHKTVGWFEKEPNPANCSIRHIEDDVDHGVIYAGNDPK